MVLKRTCPSALNFLPVFQSFQLRLRLTDMRFYKTFFDMDKRWIKAFEYDGYFLTQSPRF